MIVYASHAFINDLCCSGFAADFDGDGHAAVRVVVGCCAHEAVGKGDYVLCCSVVGPAASSCSIGVVVCY